MQRGLFAILLVLTVALGAPYAAAFLNSIMGAWTATAYEHDGTVTVMQFGQNLPRPDWVPEYPGATVVQASRVVPAKSPGGVGFLDLATRASLEDVKRFYGERLAATGFSVHDEGTGPVNAATARFLGIDGILSGRRTATDDYIQVTINTPEGLIPSRLLQLQWRKLSEWERAVAEATRR